MTKNKRILLSLCISLVLLLIFNLVYLKLKKEEELSVLIVTKDIATGEKITADNTKSVVLKAHSIAGNYVSELNDKSFSNCILKAGQVLTEDLVVSSASGENGEYENITLPVTNADDAASYKLKKGQNVNIYYTAKYSDVSEALTGMTNAEYSSNAQDCAVTVKLYENTEVISLTDSVGAEGTLYTQIQIRVKKEDVAKLVCLKQFGTFTLTMSR